MKKEENTEVKTDEDMKSVIAKVKEEVALEDEIEARNGPEGEVEVIEKIILKPPFRIKQLFSNHSCFIYTSGVNQNIISGYTKDIINSDEAVVLSCGSYLIDWIQNKLNINDNHSKFSAEEKKNILRKLNEVSLSQKTKKSL